MPLTVYQGFNVLEVLRDRSDAGPDSHSRAFDVIGPDAGAKTSLAVGVAPHVDREFIWKATSQAEVSSIRSFIDGQQGRLIPFWVPSLDRNFEFNAFPGSGSTWTIKAIGYAANMFPNHGGRRHVYARHPVVGYRYGKVIGAVDNGDGTETLTFSTGLGVNISNAFWLVGFLKLYRLAVDQPVLSWSGRSFVTVRFPLIELPLEAPL